MTYPIELAPIRGYSRAQADARFFGVTGTLPIGNGGTGAVTAAAARVALGIEVTTKAEMITALATGASVQLAASLTSMTLDTADMATFLANVHKIRAYETTTITLPAGVDTTTTGNIMRVSAANANLRIFGADPVVTSATSVASVTGTAGAWSITYNVASVAGIAVGDYAKLFDVAPLPVLSGDNVASYVLRNYPVLGELCVPRVNVGVCTIVDATSTATFSGGLGTLSDTIKVGNLLTVKGQTLEVTVVNDGTDTVTVNGTWSNGGVSSSSAFYSTRPNTGTISTSGASQQIDGAGGTLFTSQGNVGDVLLAGGQLLKITAITDDDTLTVDKPVTLGAGTVFSILQSAACLHEGLHLVTAVGASTVTLTNVSQVQPPLNGVSVDEFKVLKTVLRNTGTGDGIVFDQNGALREMDNIALVGAGNSTGSIGVLLQNRIESEIAGDGTTSFGDVTQHGLRGTILFGENMASTRWGRGAMVGHGCLLNARKASFNGNLDMGCWVLEGGFANLRRAQVNANAGIGLSVNAGGGALITEMRAAGNTSDGLRTDANTSIYGESFMLVANASMNYRSLDTGKVHMTNGVSLLATASGFYFDGGKGKINGTVIGANGRAGIEGLNQAEIQGDNVWVSGTSNTAGTGYGIVMDEGSSFNGDNFSCFDNEGSDLRVGTTAGRIIATNAYYSTLSGVASVNEFSVNGSVIMNGAATVFGLPATKVAGALEVTGIVNASGGKVQFPAAASLSTNVNTLDDYEEGTYVPTVVSTSGSLTTVASNTGNYTKIGNRVFFSATATFTDIGTGAQSITFTTPSFTPATSQPCSAVNVTAAAACYGLINTAGTVSVRTVAGAFPVANGQILRIAGQYDTTG